MALAMETATREGLIYYVMRQIAELEGKLTGAAIKGDREYILKLARDARGAVDGPDQTKEMNVSQDALKGI